MKKLLFTLTITILSHCLYAQTPTYSGGDGSLSCPFQIATACDLLDLMQTPNHWDKNFILIDDIDCIQINASPIGHKSSVTSGNMIPFTGSFFGNNHTIYNLSIISTQSSIGLFGQINNNAIITGINLKNIHIEGNTLVGGLCGVIQSGHISNSNVYGGIIKGKNNTGGLVGRNSSNISNCSVINCKIEGKIINDPVQGQAYWIGGLAGKNHGGTIRACHTDVQVEALRSLYIGGLCGGNHEGGVIEYCTSTGYIRSGSWAGGFCGMIGHWDDPSKPISKIRFCHTSANVCINRTGSAGGFIGGNCMASFISNCSSSGNVISINNLNTISGNIVAIGGFAGMTKGGEIKKCIATGKTCTSNNPNTTFYAGGFVGRWHNNAPIINCAAYGNVHCNINTGYINIFYGDCAGGGCSMNTNKFCQTNIVNNPATKGCCITRRPQPSNNLTPPDQTIMPLNKQKALKK